MSSSRATGAPNCAGVVVRDGYLPFLVLPLTDAGVGPLEWGVYRPSDGGGISKLSSAPLRRKPSKRPEVKISHSSSDTADRVARASCKVGLLSIKRPVSASRGGADNL